MEVRAEKCRRRLAEFIRQGWAVLEPTTPLTWNWHIDAIALHVQAALEDWMGRQRDPDYPQRFQNLLVNVPPGTAKPVYNGCMVTEQKRGRIALKDVRVGDRVLTHRGRFRRVLAVHDQGVLPLLEIETKRGRVLKLAHDHPVLTARGWVEARHLTPADVLAEVHASEPCGSATLTPEAARLLAYLIGDGIVKYAKKAFTNQDPEAVADFVACAAVCGFETSVRRRSGRASDTSIVTLKGAPGYRQRLPRGSYGPVRQWLDGHDLEGKCSYDKRVPAAIMAGNADLITEFVAAYWSCDGGVEDRRDLPRSGRPGQVLRTVRVACTTVSEGLARDLQHLLTRLGLSFTLRRKAAQLKTRRQGDLYVSWMLSAESQDVAAKFMQVVGPRMRHEKRARAAGLARTSFDRPLNPDPIKEIRPAPPGECRCLTVEEDKSFTVEDLAVHNSRIVSVFTPAWMWLRWPSWRSIFLSANPRVALRDSVYCRDLIESDWYRDTFAPAWTLADDQNAKSLFNNTAGGYRQAMGFSSRITGDRADALFVDDPHDADEVTSDLIRQGVLDRWDGAIANRLNDLRCSVRVGIMQRLHEADWSGHVLKQGGWEHLCLPQEFEPERARVTAIGWRDPRTEAGELLFPARFPCEVLDAERRRLGSAGYAGQHQQRPAPAEGAMFKKSWLRHYRRQDGPPVVFELGERFVPLTACRVFGTGDLATSLKTSADYTALALWADDRRGNLILLEMVHKRLEGPDIVPELERLHAKWKPQFFALDSACLHLAIIQEARRKGLAVRGLQPHKDKVTRAVPATVRMEAGQVWLPAEDQAGAWLGEFISELLHFPMGEHDDTVDALSHACDDMVRNANPSSPPQAMGGGPRVGSPVPRM